MTEEKPSAYFTKYLFKTGLECPTRLYYNKQDYPENQTPFPFIAHLRFNKKMLFKLLESLFAEGESVENNAIEEAAEETAYKLQDENTVLFAPVFIFDKAMAKVPVLKKEGESVTIFEVHTKAYNPGRHRLINHHGKIYSKWKDYLLGLAYKYHIISHLYPRWNIRTELVLPRKNASAGRDDLYQLLQRNIQNAGKLSTESGLLHFLDVQDELQRILSGSEWEEGSRYEGQSFAKVFDSLNEQYQSGEKLTTELGYKCKSCAFNLDMREAQKEDRSGFKECFGDTSGSVDKVFDLIGPGTKEWIEEGIYLQQNIPDDEVTDLDRITNSTGRITEKYRQSLQIMKAKDKEIPREMIRPELFEELERWEYPIHFLDFEAGNYAVPLRSDRKPYHLVVFQYSCHTLYEDGRWEHHQWIDPMDGDYPNFELVRNLKSIPGILEGTIVQYSQFERYALKVIRKELMNEEQDDGQDLLEWIENIIGRHDSTQQHGPYLADLSRLVKNYYYNHHMQNSLSIKDVLRSVMAQSEELKKIYSKPYESQNFEQKIWWQKNGSGDVINPYDLLPRDEETNVRRGTEAMVAYAKSLSGQLTDQEKARLQDTLLRYCELDTLAMVMIYQHWKGLAKRNSGTSSN
ncbi:MAG: DUF2779 domain-containing protein [Balneolaceae bacterium]|nr:DUF2779 domain-containing protein [Balneolaceae bacterium]